MLARIKKSTLNKSLIVAGFAALTISAVLSNLTIGFQQRAISTLLNDASLDLSRDAIASEYITKLHQILNDHVEEGCISSAREDKLLQQMDLLMAASRAGWRQAERLLKTPEFQEISKK
jgi:hypothetical protein|tara:strand:- start:130 stop:486 length:357 start_codon:yes stop_codon:yes gene_type:complete